MTELDVYLSPCNERARRIAAARLQLTLEKYDLLRQCRVKWCSGCQAWLNVREFSVHHGKGDGLQTRCIHCCRSRR